MIQRITDNSDDKAPHIIERPDGFYWVDPETGVEFGPFATASEAIADMGFTEESDYESGGILAEAEAELGISDWIDPDTGVPAEDSIPHLDD